MCLGVSKRCLNVVVGVCESVYVVMRTGFTQGGFLYKGNSKENYVNSVVISFSTSVLSFFRY